MRHWSHVPPLDVFSNPFDLEFSARHARATRRRLLNFEMFPEPFVVERDATGR
ncbi:MAG: hypothetical protein KGJ10_04515 [Acidobacteriota bacterium]|nr:hypothetical protein [Acidobacteriota bacterium]MDE3044072.1 hypothetical protein [Acidobacteriota bacterium]